MRPAGDATDVFGNHLIELLLLLLHALIVLHLKHLIRLVDVTASRGIQPSHRIRESLLVIGWVSTLQSLLALKCVFSLLDRACFCMLLHLGRVSLHLSTWFAALDVDAGFCHLTVDLVHIHGNVFVFRFLVVVGACVAELLHAAAAHSWDIAPSTWYVSRVFKELELVVLNDWACIPLNARIACSQRFLSLDNHRVLHWGVRLA